MRFAEQWSWCTVEAVNDVTPTIREFRLRPENGHVPPYPAGSHIGVTVLIDGQPARRSYSLVENSDPNTYRIAVRLAPDSRGGSRGMWNLRPGARIVEIGSFRGRSAIVLARAAPEGAEVVAIDPHLGSDRGPQEIAEDRALGEAGVAGAVNQAQAGGGEPGPELASCLGIGRIATEARAGDDADGLAGREPARQGHGDSVVCGAK